METATAERPTTVRAGFTPPGHPDVEPDVAAPPKPKPGENEEEAEDDA